MAKANILNTRTINYLELIGNGRSYRAPAYQRDYSWSEEEWEDVWNDIIELRPEAEAVHYMGALVVEGSNDRESLIIDGQQRLATLSLFALAVIAKLKEMAAAGIDSEANAERSQGLRDRFVGEKDPASLTESSRLYLNATDDAFYQDYLVQLRPHKIEYYLEKRDPEFDTKMAQVLVVYKQVELARQRQGAPKSPLTVFVSYDEKPGIQAIGGVAPDRPPKPGKHEGIGRDYEYQRHGTLTLMAGLDLMTGQIHRAVVERHRSREFVAFLRQLDRAYPAEARIRLVLDNHSAHVSKQTRAYLATMANRFEFVFTPKHGSWLNVVESFFAKLTNTLLRGMRVESKAELQQRIEAYIDRLNQDPVVFKWTYKMDEISVV